ncbi:SCO family protein [Marinoscillum furvescens]|uniref:Protein SCO1/2 n=1 Tax=Marinoscillum furvescens DSM 4134 TaxID=1122208 RepID=A0A3D9LG67_MARFU|nr:SCO family protein [Marinoscillum furvescens]REE05597.1 protein SCO1/2 [Marinoscillum furvescens DSM 4134]
MQRNKWIGWILILLVLAGCSAKNQGPTEVPLPYYNQADFTPEWIERSSASGLHAIGDFNLTNQLGEPVTRDSLLGKIYVANFFFTICPTICPRMASNLDRVQQAYLDDDQVMLVSHSVMPWVDSVAVLRDYAAQRGILSHKWLLLTGDKKQIYQLGRSSYFADEGFGKSVTDESNFLHTENIVLIDPNMHIRGVYNGTLPLEMARLIEDIEKLKREQSAT